MSDKPVPLAAVWRRRLLESDLSTNTKMVGLAINDHTNGDGLKAKPGQKRLAALASVSVSTVKRSSNELEEKGWVRRSRPSRRESTHYALTFPTALNETPEWGQAVTSLSGVNEGSEWGQALTSEVEEASKEASEVDARANGAAANGADTLAAGDNPKRDAFVALVRREWQHYDNLDVLVDEGVDRGLERGDVVAIIAAERDARAVDAPDDGETDGADETRAA